MDAAVVGVTADAVVGDAHGDPYRSLAARAFAYHLQYPDFVGVCDGEAFALAFVAVLLRQFRHDVDGLACSLGALQGEHHQRTVVDEAGDGVGELFPAAEGRLMDGELMFVHQADDAVGVGYFGHFAQVVACLVVVEGVHGPCGMVGGRDDAERFERAVGVLAVGDDDAAILRGLLADNQVGAGRGY